jgi:predicted DNA-binding transcriptional regulator AlpA
MPAPKHVPPVDIPTRHIDLRQVIALTNACATSIDRWEAAGRFPRRIVRGPRSVAWRLDQIQEWLEHGPDAWANRHRPRPAPERLAARGAHQ